IFIIIIIAIIWSMSHTADIVAPKISDVIPSGNNISSRALFITVMFSLFGLEISAIHAANVKNAKKNFTLAQIISGSVILGS
ncbi:amino acid transporter, partial [Francisella tularensis subsp. holarctica]|nr:amino acid transporter [Francisella tularensis subsp. holarctica]